MVQVMQHWYKYTRNSSGAGLYTLSVTAGVKSDQPSDNIQPELVMWSKCTKDEMLR